MADAPLCHAADSCLLHGFGGNAAVFLRIVTEPLLVGEATHDHHIFHHEICDGLPLLGQHRHQPGIFASLDGVDITALQENLPGTWLVPAQKGQEGAFAAAIGPHDGRHVPLPEMSLHIFQDFLLPYPVAKILYRKHINNPCTSC